ncbi:MAG: hypothetical protein ACOCX3_02620 [Chloroflexota bacterium]
MTIIILLTLVVVGAVLYYGIQHDPHTSIRSVESSRSVQTLQAQATAAARKLEAQVQQKRSQGETSDADEDEDEKKAGAVAAQLGDEEAKRKRREAALARKAARQQGSSEG